MPTESKSIPSKANFNANTNNNNNKKQTASDKEKRAFVGDIKCG